MTEDDVAGRPPLPPGRLVELPGRGMTFVRELSGPPGAPTVLLLHGWTANADLNWFAAYAPLAEHFRVVALDHRGHGRGIRSKRRFRLDDCADDAAALLEVLGIEHAIAVGYSMGGPIALLLWRRHWRLVDGLVLCATALQLTTSSAVRSRLNLLGLFGLGVRALPTPAVRAMGSRVLRTMNARRQLAEWVGAELLRGDGRSLLEAGAEIGRWDGRHWAGEVGVPTSVVVTTLDELVAPAAQRAMAQAIPGAEVHDVAGRHQVCVTDPGAFVPSLLTACLSVAARLRP